MARLLEDAAKLKGLSEDAAFEYVNKGVNGNLSNIIDAIHIVQTEIGITGTTALEAGRTISGSVGAMKSAWTNLLIGLADGNADVGKLVNNLVTTIVGDGTESNLGVFGNIMPAVKTALTGASNLVGELLPKIVQEVPGIINENLPILAEAAISIIQSLVDGISQNQEMLMDTAFETITYLSNSLISMLPQIVKLGLDLIVSLANGIAESLPDLIPTIVDVILQIADTLTDPKQLSNILQAALVLITNLAWGIVNSIPNLIDSVFAVVDGIITFLLDPKNLGMLIQSAVELVIAIGLGLVEAIPKLMTSVGKLITNIVSYFFNYDWGSLGRNLVEGFKRGIQNAWYNLKNWFRNLFGDLIGIAKKILGIASPSKAFAKLGGFTAEGFGVGFEDEFDHVKDDIENALNFDDASVGINASIRKVGAGTAGGAFGGTSIGSVTINIDGANYDDPRELAMVIAEELQNMAERSAAVYA